MPNPIAVQTTESSANSYDTDDVMIERSASSKRGKTAALTLITINIVLSLCFFVIMDVQGQVAWSPKIKRDFTTGNVMAILYFLNVFFLAFFYTGLLVMFGGILYSIIKLVKQYDLETYNLTKVRLWAYLIFIIFLMTFRVFIFLALRFNPLHSKRVNEVIFYASEVILIGLVIYVVYRTKNSGEEEEE